MKDEVITCTQFICTFFNQKGTFVSSSCYVVTMLKNIDLLYDILYPTSSQTYIVKSDLKSGCWRHPYWLISLQVSYKDTIPTKRNCKNVACSVNQWTISTLQSGSVCCLVKKGTINLWCTLHNSRNKWNLVTTSLLWVLIRLTWNRQSEVPFRDTLLGPQYIYVLY